MHQIGAADDADHAAFAHHRKPLDAAALHQLDDFLQRIVFADDAWIGRHDLFDFSARRMHVVLRQLAGTDNELEPFRAAALGAELAAAQKVALGHDADQLAVLVENRQAADPVLQHQPRGFEDLVVALDGNHVPRHDIFDLHGRRPFGFEFVRLTVEAQPFMRVSAKRLRNTMRRDVGTSIVAAVSSDVSVRDTVSMVSPR